MHAHISLHMRRKTHMCTHTNTYTHARAHAECLKTRDQTIILKVLHILQLLVVADTAQVNGRSGGLIGQALVPYYRQVLPILNIFCKDNKIKDSDQVGYQNFIASQYDSLEETPGWISDLTSYNIIFINPFKFNSNHFRSSTTNAVRPTSNKPSSTR